MGLHLDFSYPWTPWLFLLLIPAFALTLIPYFRLDKRFRRTRNRVISMVLHLMIMTLAICVLTGMTFVYDVPNDENEILLLVDMSDTEAESDLARDEFVHTLLEQCKYDGFKVGVVTFGYDQVYAVPLTYDVESIYDAYLDAPLPDTSATDIASALNYAKSVLTNPQTSKIVLVSDGKETDGSAGSVVRAIAAQGTRVDTVYISSDYQDDLVQVVGVEFPAYHLNPGEECSIVVSLYSKTATPAIVELSDNGDSAEDGMKNVNLAVGRQSITFQHTFEGEGLHEIDITVTATSDGLVQNNVYHAYLYLDVYNRILLVEKYDGQSEKLLSFLESEDADFKFDVDVLNLTVAGDTPMPETVDDFRKYDQVILNNVANSDLPEGFVENLYSYVNDYGGGLFTVGGEDEDGNAHAYSRKDLNKTLLQQMLPVEAIEYTPPVGVYVLIDTSGSMTSEAESGGGSKVFWAQQGAIACLDALTERDYIGASTFDDGPNSEFLPLTRRTEDTYIREQLNKELESGGGTLYSYAIRTAAIKLINREDVAKRHIIFITDGMPSDSDKEAYQREVQNAADQGITISTVFINGTSSSGSSSSGGNDASGVLEWIAEHGGGRAYTSSGRDLLAQLRQDLNLPQVREQEEKDFSPQVTNALSPVFAGVELQQKGMLSYLTSDLHGFFGVRERQGAETLLVGEYEVPIYAQWAFGKGMVGSFMCDLYGKWSDDFLADPNALRFLRNAVNNLMPTEDIHPSDITLLLREKNYTNTLSVFTDLEDGQTVRGTIVNTQTGEETTVSLNALPTEEEALGDVYVTLALSADNNNFSRCNFVVKKSGTYRITVTKLEADGTELATTEIYKAFAYSEEYNGMIETDPQAFLSDLAVRGDGSLIADNEDPWEVVENFETEISLVYDPRWLFAGLIIALFLLDIAVRKFKFKWPHEIIREHREKKA